MPQTIDGNGNRLASAVKHDNLAQAVWTDANLFTS